MFDILFYFIHTALLNVIAVMYLRYLLPFRLKYKALLFLLVIFMTVMSYIESHYLAELFRDNRILNFLINCSVFFLSLFFFRDIKRGALYILQLEVIALLSEGFIFHLLAIIAPNAAPSVSMLLGQVISLLLFGGLAVATARQLKSIEKMDIPRSYWLTLIIIPISSITVLYTIFGLSEYSDNMPIAVMATMFILLVLLFGSVILYSHIIDYFNIKIRNQSLNMQIDAYVDKQAHMAALRTKTGTIVHDLKNRLLPILSTLEENNVEKARRLLAGLIGEMQSDYCISDTGIACIDDMINYKAGIAKRQNIHMQFDNRMQDRPAIPAEDISTAIGIALDNAMEACQKNRTNRTVTMHAYCQKGIFCIVIENALSENLRISENGDFLTTKQDKGNHGLGINSIRNLLHKNDGSVIIRVQDGMFKLKLVCPSRNA